MCSMFSGVTGAIKPAVGGEDSAPDQKHPRGASLRVLHLIGGLEPRAGGPSFVMPAMCGALARRGHEVTVMTTKARRAAAPIPGIPGVRLRYFERRFPARFGTAPALARALRASISDFDVVHIHSIYLFQTLVGAWVCRRHGVPYAIRPHGTLHAQQRQTRRLVKAAYGRLIEQRNLDGAAAMHYTSPVELRHAEEAGAPARGHVIPHGVDPLDGEENRGAFFGRHPELAGRRAITYLGRLAARKRPDLLVEAFAAIAPEFPDAHLVIAGPDDELTASELRARAESLGIGARVCLPGLVTGPAKSDLLQGSYAFVLPTDWENFAVSVSEAMAAGLPVIVTPGVDIHEQVSEAEAGLVVEGTCEELAAALRALLQDPAAAAKMGRRGQVRARSAFTWERVGEQLESMYRQMMTRSDRATAPVAIES
jgi:glycosyltransferase involved in cell wall biosynthesis